MGVRFRKSVNLGGGLRMNMSKSGVGFSFGKKGARVSVNKRGVTRTVGIPGSGIYDTKTTSWKKGSKKSAPQKAQGSGGAKAIGFAAGFIIFGCMTLPWGIIAIIIGICIFIAWLGSVLPAPSETHKPEIAPLPNPVASDATVTSGLITLVSVTNPAYSGESGEITVQGFPNTEYKIVVKYDSTTSRSKSLTPKVSDSQGIVSWSWNIRTAGNDADITISGGNQVFTQKIKVY